MSKSKNEMGGSFSSYRGRERRVQGFGGKPEGKRSLGRPRRRWKIILRRDFKK
jgi:hypothetical protein